jgi:hypothetical protein
MPDDDDDFFDDDEDSEDEQLDSQEPLELDDEPEPEPEPEPELKTSARKSPQRVCLECGAPGLVALITIRRTAPLTATGASVKVGGLKVGQLDLRDAFVARPDGTPRPVRGPIFCESCGAEHYLTVGKKTILHLGTMTGVDPEAV